MSVGRSLRFKVLMRDEFKCVYCGKTANDGARLEVDHVLPVHHRGGDDSSNLVAACWDCNHGKLAKLIPEEIMNKVLVLVKSRQLPPTKPRENYTSRFTEGMTRKKPGRLSNYSPHEAEMAYQLYIVKMQPASVVAFTINQKRGLKSEQIKPRTAVNAARAHEKLLLAQAKGEGK
jgi:HNH endonuclease